jgi:class 3 adenylate cyclase
MFTTTRKRGIGAVGLVASATLLGVASALSPLGHRARTTRHRAAVDERARMTVTTGTAAVLFTDMVGSTELLSRLGEAAFDVLRRDHFADLRDTISRTGGTEVKSTGDGVLATFTSAAGAIECAVGMQQTVAWLGASTGLRLAIRVGLALGDVSFEDGDVFGAPVIEAARLVAAASGGQILATAVVRLVAGRRSEAVFTDLGCVDLKGLPAPVPTCEVAWEPDRRVPDDVQWAAGPSLALLTA